MYSIFATWDCSFRGNFSSLEASFPRGNCRCISGVLQDLSGYGKANMASKTIRIRIKRVIRIQPVKKR